MSNKVPIAISKPDHEETYDEWFLRMVDEAIVEADSPDAIWIAHEDVEREWESQRREILAALKAK